MHLELHEWIKEQNSQKRSRQPTLAFNCIDMTADASARDVLGKSPGRNQLALSLKPNRHILAVPDTAMGGMQCRPFGHSEVLTKDEPRSGLRVGACNRCCTIARQCS